MLLWIIIIPFQILTMKYKYNFKTATCCQAQWKSEYQHEVMIRTLEPSKVTHGSVASFSHSPLPFSMEFLTTQDVATRFTYDFTKSLSPFCY